MTQTVYPGLLNPSAPSAEEVYVLNHPDIQTRRWLNPSHFNDVNHARDWLRRSGIYDYNGQSGSAAGAGAGAVGSAENKSSLEGLLEKGYSRLAQDRARLAGMNYPAYRGDTISPMSDLTQRARGLQEYYAGKASPYSDRISSTLSRPTGLSTSSTDSLLGATRDKQRSYSDSLLGHLQKEFRSSYNDRVERFQRQSNQGINRGMNEFSGKLGDINTLSRNLDQNANQAAAKALQGLSTQKKARRNLLIDNLEQFGNQKHALNNLKLQADKASFDSEVQEPHNKANMLEEVLSRGNRAVQNGIHPDLEGSMFSQVNQAMNAYNAPTSKYKGELIADSNPELDTSQELMGRLSSGFKDSFYNDRKDLINKVSNPSSSVSNNALDKVPDAIRGQIEQLEHAGKKRLRSDLGALSNKYTRLGQYGSPQHMRAAEERTEELNQAILEQRNKLTQNNLQRQLQMQHQGNIGDIKQMGVLGSMGQQEFGDAIQNIRNLNRLGATKWKNKQAENEELYKNYMNEAMWMWPHMRGQAMRSGRSGAFADVFKTMQDNDISLENLANLNANYQEMEKDNDNYRTQLTNQANQYQGQLKNLQSIIDTQKRQLALNKQRQQEKQRRQAQEAARRESQRQAALRRQNEEARLRQVMQRQQTQVQSHPTGPQITMVHPQGGVYGRATFTNPNFLQGYLDKGWIRQS